MRKRKYFRDRVRIDVSDDGVTIWLDDTWIIDASTFLKDKTLYIDTERLKYIPPEKNQGVYKQLKLKRSK